ncbi:sulfotransferase [Paenibacillus sp. NRS-1782]|uniref:sulfotransferase n=1 Tax=unclassified Paenibacillus TaxID=185978 RepID=UPI003D2C8AA8
MIDKQGEGLVFLLSVPRSGSSLVTTILQSHTRLFATQEMWFLFSLYDLPQSQAHPYEGTGITLSGRTLTGCWKSRIRITGDL